MAVVTLIGDGRYTADDLTQWDKNQTLEIRGLNLPQAPEIHFSNSRMTEAIVKQSEMSKSGIVTVEIPNIILEESLSIDVWICGYEGETFVSMYHFTLKVKGRSKPADYIAEDDEKIYSYNALENLVNNTVVNLTRANEDLHKQIITEVNTLNADNQRTIVEEVNILNGQTITEVNRINKQTVDEVNISNTGTVEKVEKLKQDVNTSLNNIKQTIADSDMQAVINILNSNVVPKVSNVPKIENVTDDNLRMSYLEDLIINGDTGFIANDVKRFECLTNDNSYREFLYTNYADLYFGIVEKLGILGKEINSMLGTDLYKNISNSDDLATETNLIVNLFEKNNIFFGRLNKKYLCSKIKDNNSDVVQILMDRNVSIQVDFQHDKGLIFYVMLYSVNGSSDFVRLYVDGKNVDVCFSGTKFCYDGHLFTDKSKTYCKRDDHTSNECEIYYLPITSEVT